MFVGQLRSLVSKADDAMAGQEVLLPLRLCPIYHRTRLHSRNIHPTVVPSKRFPKRNCTPKRGYREKNKCRQKKKAIVASATRIKQQSKRWGTHGLWGLSWVLIAMPGVLRVLIALPGDASEIANVRSWTRRAQYGAERRACDNMRTVRMPLFVQNVSG